MPFYSRKRSRETVISANRRAPSGRDRRCEKVRILAAELESYPTKKEGQYGGIRELGCGFYVFFIFLAAALSRLLFFCGTRWRSL